MEKKKMDKFRSIILVGIFQIILIYLCAFNGISGQKAMIDIAYIHAKIFVKEHTFNNLSDDSRNGQHLRDIYGEVLEILDEDEIVIQTLGDEESVVTVKGVKFKSVIKNAQVADKIKVTYLVRGGEGNIPSTIYMGQYGEILLLK